MVINATVVINGKKWKGKTRDGKREDASGKKLKEEEEKEARKHYGRSEKE